MKKLLLVVLVAFAMAFSLTGCMDDLMNETIESSTNTRADQEVDADSATILVYMIGSDLESDGGCATSDLEEMCQAEFGKNVKVILQTGGTKTWQNDSMKDGRVQRFRIKDGELVKLDTVGKCKDISMVSSKTLKNFLKWGMKKYPADRYGVIFWDHGGGSIIGFGADEYHEDKSLSIAGIRKAFKDADAHVDFVGFDACLMGTIETAYALHDYSDYMIASEETEPGSGWDYRNWLTELSDDPGMSMKALAKTIIDDFVEGEDASWLDDLTLALYDLKDTKKAYKEISEYFDESRYAIRHDGFDDISDARLLTRGYGNDDFEQIDIRSYMEKDGVEGDELSEILEDMIVYYRGNISDSTGMAIYYPYMYLDYYSDMTGVMDKIGMKKEGHRGYFDDFVSILAKGKMMDRSTKAKASIATQLTGAVDQGDDENYEDEDWYDEDAAESGYSANALFKTDEDLEFTEKGDGFILDLTDKQWASIAKAEMELFIADEDGYMFFGRDSRVDYDKNGDLIADFDFNWVCLNDQFVPFYIISDYENEDGYEATGYIPAIINEGTKQEEDIDIYVRWNDEHEDGVVLGYTPYKSEEESMSVANKNFVQFEAGDTLDFYCDFYKDNGDFDDVYYVGDQLKVGKKGVTVSYGEMDSEGVQIGYRLVDKYMNEYWTEILEY